jgi:hypothetical protein
MQAQKREDLMHLCEKASQEQNSDSLMVLIKEITQLLDEAEKDRVRIRTSPPRKNG